jgi:hypothetical protein
MKHGDQNMESMQDEPLDEMIRMTLMESRRPPEPPLDGMWQQIEARAFEQEQSRYAIHIHRSRWIVPALAAAAALVIGVGLGWSLAPRGGNTTPVQTVASNHAIESHTSPASSNDAAAPVTTVEQPRALPVHEVTKNVSTPAVSNSPNIEASRLASHFDDVGNTSEMGRYLMQTGALLASLPTDRADTAVATRAGDLLTQTHLLLDSQAGSDPTLHRLLEDLELVLAQVARLRGQRNEADLQLIHQALTVHDVLPRVHDASVEASITD